MRIFWHQGGLHIEPEGDQERVALATLVDNVSFGMPQGTIIPSGASELGGDQLFEAVAGNHEAGPRSFASKGHHKQHVISINKLL